MLLCSIDNRVQGRRVRWICLFITDHAQHQLLQQLICHLYSPRETSVGCFSLSLLRLRMPGTKAACPPDWTVMCALYLQGDNGGMTTMSNMTHRVSREEDGLELTCEAFNKGTRFSKTQTAKLIVYCEWAEVWFFETAVLIKLLRRMTFKFCATVYFLSGTHSCFWRGNL